MGTLIYGFTTSVDGYIADAHGNIDWSDPSDELHQYWNDFERDTATSFYGRRIYELMAGHWPAVHESADADPIAADFAAVWCNMPKVVFSSTTRPVDWNTRLVTGDAVTEITRLKAEDGGPMDIGGATLAAAAMRGGLIDEYVLVTHPVLVGDGKSFFTALDNWVNLALVETRTFPGGVLLTRYETRR